MNKDEVELGILRRLEQLIRSGIYDHPGNFEEHTEDLHGLLGDLDHVRSDDVEAGTIWILPAGSSALIIGPTREVTWVMDQDPQSESAAWVTIAAAAIGAEEVADRLKAELFGNIEA